LDEKSLSRREIYSLYLSLVDEIKERKKFKRKKNCRKKKENRKMKKSFLSESLPSDSKKGSVVAS